MKELKMFIGTKGNTLYSVEFQETNGEQRKMYAWAWEISHDGEYTFELELKDILIPFKNLQIKNYQDVEPFFEELNKPLEDYLHHKLTFEDFEGELSKYDIESKILEWYDKIRLRTVLRKEKTAKIK